MLVKDEIYTQFMTGSRDTIELFHRYTYSGNPVAGATPITTLDVYKEDDLFLRASALILRWQEALHRLTDHPFVADIRNIGLIGAIESEPIKEYPTKRAFSAFLRVFEKGCLIRTTGDIIALSPPIIISMAKIDDLVGCVGEVLSELE
tara:strand:- start:162 stop:605 length:444 start_codon:yes stop_codon:yes gene_type:complete